MYSYTYIHTYICFAATQFARPLHQERLQVACSKEVARKRLAGRHYHNVPWTHECCFEVDVFLCWEWIEELK